MNTPPTSFTSCITCTTPCNSPKHQSQIRHVSRRGFLGCDSV